MRPQRPVDGATRGIRCAATNDLGYWCSRDAGHYGAHESRNDRGRGLIAWWNNEYRHPFESHRESHGPAQQSGSESPHEG